MNRDEQDRKDRPPEGEGFSRLADIIRRLRAPDGCPWDREQTHESIRPHLLEETYEFFEALESGDDEMMADELGDILLHVLFHAQIASESGRFDIGDVIEAISTKLVERHPHVFGDGEARTSEEVILQVGKRHFRKVRFRAT